MYFKTMLWSLDHVDPHIMLPLLYHAIPQFNASMLRSLDKARFIYTGKLRLSQTQQGDVCFLMGLLRAADQFCVAAAILMVDGLIEGWKTDTDWFRGDSTKALAN